MEAKAETIKMQMDGDEVYDIAWSILHDLRGQIKDHWNTLQQEKDGEPLFFEQNKKLLEIMKKMFEVSGYSHCYESAISEYKKSFADKREERKNSAPIKS